MTRGCFQNRALARDLSQLLGESNQEIPEFLLRMAAEGRTPGNNRQVNRRFGGTDQRRGGGGGNSNSRSGYRFVYIELVMIVVTS